MKKELSKKEKNEELFKKIKEGLKIFFKYYLISIPIVITLILLHYPPIYYDGTTISAISYFYNNEEYNQLIIFSFLILAWSFIMAALLLSFQLKWFGKILLAIFSFFVGVEKYVFYIQGENAPWNSAFSRDTLETYLSEANIGGIRDVYVAYGQDYHFWLYLVVFPIGIFLFISIILKFLKPIKPIASLSAFAAFLAMLTTFPNEVNAPYMYKVPLVIENYIIDTVMEKVLDVKRQDIYFKEIDTNKTTPENIIFIMDESIRGDLISLNNPKEKEVMQTTPYLYSIKDKLINFGNNYSMGNCSQISNMLFMSGLKNGHLELYPMIFQYMKNAGYETYLIDSPHDRLIDGFYHYDKQFIDHYISVRKKPKMERDVAGLEKLKEILKKPGKKFIYLLKQGAHFPFEENFDQKNPTLPFDKKSDRGFLNLYLNTLKVTVDDYWKKLIPIVNNTDSVVLWQGDHGVNVVPNKGDKSVKLTHCEIGLTHYKELYNVAAAMYSPNKKYYEGFKNLKNGYSNVHMLPTILDFAGYKIEDIKKYYNTTYKTPDKNVSIYTLTNWGDNIILPENVVSLEQIKKEAKEKGAIDEDIVQSPLNKRRELSNEK